jgi:phosphatidylcholine synthase
MSESLGPLVFSPAEPAGRRRRLPRRLRQFLAWCVHFYTALGLVAAAGIAAALISEPPAFRLAFVLMFAATVIDATDGFLARLVKVKEVLPGFDGRRLDDLIDFQTFTTLPLLLLWRAGVLPPELNWCLLVPLLASAYGFSQTAAKTADGYFLGFPSYWNVVAFYLFVLRPPPWVALAALLGLALLTFVPLRYLYPTMPGRLNRLSNLLAFAWGGLVAWVLWRLPEDPAAGGVDPDTRTLTALTLAYPVFYLVVSWWLSFQRRRAYLPRKRGHKPGPSSP